MFSLIHIFTLVLKLPIEFALFMSKGIMFHNWVPLYNAKSVVHSNVVFPSPRPNSYFPTLMSCKPVCQVHWFLRLHCRHYIVCLQYQHREFNELGIIFKVTHFSRYFSLYFNSLFLFLLWNGLCNNLFLLKYIMGIVSHQFTRCHHWCLLIVYTVQHTRLPDIMLKCNIIIVIVTSY